MSLLLPTRRMLLLGGDGYLLREEWNGSSVSPGRWTTTDTESKITVGSGLLSFAGGLASPSLYDPKVAYTRGLTRRAGLTLDVKVKSAATNTVGPWLTLSTALAYSDRATQEEHSIVLNSNTYVAVSRMQTARSSSVSYSASTYKYFRLVLKTTGCLYYVSDDAQSWKLIWEDTAGATGTLYPILSTYDVAGDVDYIRVRPGITNAPVVSDTFTRDDSALTLGSAETGQAWVVDNGGFGISSNKAYVPTPTTNDIATVAAVANGIIDCDVTWKTSADAYVLARYADNQNFLQFGVDNAGLLKLYKCVAGGFTDIGSYALGASDGTTYSLRLVMVDAAIKGYVGGTERISVSETAGQTNTRAGIRNGAAVAGCRWDNFTVQG